MRHTEHYRCRLCGTAWAQDFDGEDYSNDFTQCPKCSEFEFDDITANEFHVLKEKEMNVEQIRVARRAMEDAICAAVIEAMAAFHAKTGMCPQSIDVRLVDVTTVGERERRYTAGEVRADVPL